MPFLRAIMIAGDTKKTAEEVKPDKDSNEQSEAVADRTADEAEHVFPNPDIHLTTQKTGDRTLPLFSSNNDDVTSVAVGNPNKDKGTQYERYVGSKYEECGYIVDYNGINKNSHDGGIDLICHSGRYTVLVQCKCYSSRSISVNAIYQFFGASKHYATKHPREIVGSSFWTSLKLKNDSEVFIAAEELGIRIYQECKLPN